MDPSLQQDPRIYLAAERTFLAWLRTGLGLIGVGFAVSRFGLFMREISASNKIPIRTTGISAWLGVAMVALGVLVNVGAVVSHFRLVRDLSAGIWKPGISQPAVVLGVLLALLGAGMCAYLIALR